MKVFHIDQFKCTLCSNWFCPPFNLPYRLKCTHSICTNCLQKSIENKTNQIICPEDLQRNKISQININQSTKKALQRLLKQHRNFTQTSHLQCIKSLSLNFDELLDSKQIQLKNLSTLIDQVFQNQIKRLRQIYQKIKTQINRPFRVVNDWKQVVRNYLKKVKSTGPSMKNYTNELNHYIDEGRKMKLDINQYLKYDFKQLIDYLLIQPQVCFTHNFSIFNTVEKQLLMDQKFVTLNKYKNSSINKKQFQTFQKQICLQDVSHNLDQSSILVNKRPVVNHNSNKMSLFQQLIHQTPKNNKCYALSNNGSSLPAESEAQRTPLKQLIFSSSNNQSNNVKNQNSQKKPRQNQSQINFNKANNNFNSINSNINTVNSNNNTANNNFNTINSNFKTVNSNNNTVSRGNQRQDDLKLSTQFIQDSHQKDCNRVIRQKIQKLKTSQIIRVQAQQPTQLVTNKKHKLGKSLQYSPQINQTYYLNGNCLQNYSVHDSYCQESGTHEGNYRPSHNHNHPVTNTSSLLSFYQQETTTLKPTEATQAHFASPNLKFTEYIQNQQQQQQMLLGQKSNRNSYLNHNVQKEQRQRDNRYLQNPMSLKQNPNSLKQNILNNNNIQKEQRQKNHWQLESLNFLKEWKINRDDKSEDQLQIIQRYGGYDCQKEKNKYARKIQEHKVREILSLTNIAENYIELVSHSLADCNLSLFLNQINWNYLNIEIVKFIKTSLTDQQLNQLLNFLVRSNVHTLMLSYNNLSQLSLDALLNFVEVNNKLRNIYLPKNNISLLKGNARAKMNLLKDKGINLYI